MALPQLEGSVPRSEVLMYGKSLCWFALSSPATKFGIINDHEHSSNMTRKIIFKLGCAMSASLLTYAV